MKFLTQSGELEPSNIEMVTLVYDQEGQQTTPPESLVCSQLLLILASTWSESLCDKNHCFVYWCIMVHCSRLFFLIFWFKVNIIQKFKCIFNAEIFPKYFNRITYQRRQIFSFNIIVRLWSSIVRARIDCENVWILFQAN